MILLEEEKYDEAQQVLQEGKYFLEKTINDQRR